MEELIKMLDRDFEYVGHEICGEEIHIQVKSEREGAECPNCGKISRRLHSRYKRKLQDFSIVCQNSCITCAKLIY